jgi:hypothetical protein
MGISLKTHKILWGRAAGHCSEPTCRKDVYEDETETDDATLVGENCHIVAEKDDGPRGDPSMAKEQRGKYENLILLCRNHHKIVDAQPGKYTVEVLHKMKDEHEEWVRTQLGFDSNKQRDDVLFASIIDEWERLAHVDEWQVWSGAMLFAGQPRMLNNVDQDLMQLRGWLLGRIWSGRYPLIERAFHNFRHVLQDMH